MDEVFGESNFAGLIGFYKTSSQSTNKIQSTVDYLVVYAKDKARQKFGKLLTIKQPGDRGAKQYISVISADMTEIRRMTKEELAETVAVPEGWKVCRLGPATSHVSKRIGVILTNMMVNNFHALQIDIGDTTYIPTERWIV